jgi:hypothetical protein
MPIVASRRTVLKAPGVIFKKLRCATPSQPEGLLEPSEMDLDERMNATVGVRLRITARIEKSNTWGSL